MNIIIFDDECVLCNRAIRWIDKYDTHNHFTYAVFDDIDFIIEKLELKTIPKKKQSLIYISEQKIYYKSQAIKNILLKSNPHFFVKLIQFCPSFIIDFFYVLIAKNRYRLLGKQRSCQINSRISQKMFVKYLVKKA